MKRSISAAGAFIYIALVDMLPEIRIHGARSKRHSFKIEIFIELLDLIFVEGFHENFITRDWDNFGPLVV